MFATIVKHAFLQATGGAEALQRRSVAGGKLGPGHAGKLLCASLLCVLVAVRSETVASLASGACTTAGAGGECLEARLAVDTASDAASLLQFSLPHAAKAEDFPAAPMHATLSGLMQLAGSKESSTATELLQQVRSIAKSVAEGAITADPTTVGIINDLINMLNTTTMQAINTGMIQDQSEVTRLTAAADQCSIAPLDETTVTDRRSELASCLVNQSALAAAKTAADSALSGFLADLQPPPTFPESRTVESVRAYFLSLTDYVNAKSTLLDSLVANAAAAAAGLAAQKASCGTKQGVFENAFCDLRAESNSSCVTYSGCYDGAAAAYNSALPGLEEAEAARKAQYTALQKAFCFLEILKSSEPSSAKVTACDSLAVGVGFLNINYPGVPPAKTCTTISERPCTAGFLQDEYSKYTEWSAEMNGACRSC